MARLPVVHVRDAALVGPFHAVVGGYSAWFLSQLIARDLERVVARSGVPPERRADVRRAFAALEEAGANWRLEQAASASGRSERQEADSDLVSVSDERQVLLGSREAASVLGISDRRVRDLARTGQLRAERDSGGRWWVDRASVEAERDRRQVTEAAA